MLYNSVTFLLFFLAVFCIYWRLGHRARNVFLLVASLLFYGWWSWKLLPLIPFSATVNYVCGIQIARSKAPRAGKAYLLAGIATNLGVLGYFKYHDFFAESFNELASLVGLPLSVHTLNIILPIGISFYTFQAMSYTIDVYRGKIPPCCRYLDFLLYVAYFPQLVAGPIERASHLLPVLARPRRPLSTGRFLEGLKLIILGYFQKVAIADTLAPVADGILGAPAACDSLTLLTGIYAFSLQIYCDFSGYSKIARGISRLLGIELMTNFSQPYLSRNVREFWQRWHISLSTWLRDYLYIPLGGSRLGNVRTYRNLAVTMLLGGLWHGASWNFVFWGGLHGGYLIWCRLFPPDPQEHPERLLRSAARILLTFHLVSFTWLYFRLEDLPLAMLTTLSFFQASYGTPGLELLYVVVYGAMVFVLDAFLERHARRKSRHLVSLFSRNWVVETLVFTMIILATLLVGGDHAEPFIYFQF
jgi:alginate O-acetyltransferase complex protein AlgI